MKAKPVRRENGEWVQCSTEEASFVELRMPGPLPHRVLPVILKGQRAGTNSWTWNGDTEKPTLRPSIRTEGMREMTDEEVAKALAGETFDIESIICHTWVNDGKVQFLDDCSHELAGSVVDLLDI